MVKFMKKLLAGLGVLALLLVIAGWFFAARIAENRLRAYLLDHGVTVHSLHVARIWFDSVTLSDVALGEAKNVTARSLTLSRTGDAAYPYALRAEGLTVTGRAQGAVLDVGGVEKLWQKEPFPADAKTPTGFTLKGDADISFSRSAALRGDILITNASARQGEFQVRLTKLEVTPTTLPGPVYQLPFTLEQLTIISADAPVLAPLALQGNTQLDIPKAHADVTAALQDARKNFTATLAGSYALARDQGEVTLVTPTLRLGKDALDLATLLPAHAADIVTPDMKLALNARLQLAQGDWEKLAVTAVFSDAPVASILAQALGKGATLTGLLEGKVPLTVTKAGWQLEAARITNQGPMKLSLLGSKAATLTDLLGKAGTDMRALHEINVSKLDAVASTIDAKGTTTLTGTVLGHNPLLNRPVQLNLNLTTNLNDLLRSMTDPVVNTKGDR